MDHFSCLPPNCQNFLTQNVEPTLADGISHVCHQIECERNIVQAQETRRSGLVDLEQVADVAPSVTLANIT